LVLVVVVVAVVAVAVVRLPFEGKSFGCFPRGFSLRQVDK
jgi:hypothetical protein